MGEQERPVRAEAIDQATPVHPFDGYPVPRLCDDMLGAAVKGGIRFLQELIGRSSSLHVGAVVDVLTDGNTLGQLGHRTEVIGVPVRGDEVVNTGEPRVFRGSHHPICISPGRRTAIAGVDEHRLTRRGHEERGVPAFDVDEVDVQRFGCPGLGGRQTGSQPEGQQGRHRCAGGHSRDGECVHWTSFYLKKTR